MKRSFEMENLDCANCAAKMEAAIAKIEGVEFVGVNFILQRLTVEAPEEMFPRILKEAQKACRKVDADCKIIF